MKQVTISIPDKLYNSFIELFKHIPDVKIAESEKIILTESQKKTLDHRRKTAKPDDFIPWEKAKKQLRFKTKK